MYKYKKVISPILMIVLTLSLTIVIIATIFFHLTSVNTLKSKIIDIKYYDKVETNITNSLKSYMSEQDVSSLLENNRVKKDVDKLIGAMKNNVLLEEESFLKAEFEENIIEKSNEQNINVEEYVNKISNIYFNNLFPISEFSILQNIVLKYKNLVTTTLIIAIVCTILCVTYLLGSGKQKKWLFVSIYNSIIFCISLIVIFFNFTNIYYLNDVVTELLQAMVFSAIVDIVVIGIILLVIVIILNYLEYFRKVKKHKVERGVS